MSERINHESSESEPIFPGGEYAIDGVLGSGGTAVVYRARDLRRPRAVAIKVLRSDIAKIIGTDRFLREIAVTASFTHPNILPLLDSGEATDALGRSCPYYVMPLIEGETLADRLAKEHSLPVADSIRLACEMLEALRYAHQHGVIHRDIKPANVLLSAGHAVVADFGVARPIPGSARSGQSGKALTELGLIVGTPEYMSPEQALGDEKVDERCDVYAVGCVLYEMLVGTSPFDAQTAQMIVSRKISGTFSPASARRAGLPSALDQVLTKALRSDPSNRFATAAEFLNALTSIDLRRSASREAIAVGSRTLARPVMMAALVTAAIAVPVIMMMRRDKTSRAVVESPTTDKRRVAVLPFGVIATDSALDLVATALTSDLIDELAQYPALTVISKNGVLPFRDGAARADSVARFLGVGSIITGDMRGSGDSVRVTARLIDGASSAQLASVEASGAWRDVLAVRSNIIDSVTSYLRQQIGKELGEIEKRSASSVDAWELLARVKVMFDGELEQAGSVNELERAQRFGLADSLLSRAMELDPKWIEPKVTRMQLRLARANIEEILGAANVGRPGDVSIMVRDLRRQAISLADSILLKKPDDAGALHQRGRARLALWRYSSPVAPDSLRAAAEADLRAAVARRRDKADAWNDLSTLLQLSGTYAGARSAAEEALRADAFLKNPGAVIGRLFFTSLASGRVEEARSWCDRGRARFPNDARFWQCELTILGWTGNSRADVNTAWTLLASSEARDTANLLASASGARRLLVAAVAARAGLVDSARAIVRAVRASTPNGVSTDLIDFGEAHVFTMLGQPDVSIPLIERYLRTNPALRGQVRQHPWFTRLRNDPRFQAITAAQ